MSVKKIIIFIVFTLFFSVPIFGQSQAVIKKLEANVRGKPDKNAESLLTLKKDTRVELIETEDRKGWRFVSFKKKKGWVRKSNVNVLIDELSKDAAWLYMGRSRKEDKFSVGFYLNLSQMVRNEDVVSFYTKIIPDKKKPYLKILLPKLGKLKPQNFRYNVDLWEGNCKSKDVWLKKSFLYWKNDVVNGFEMSNEKISADSNSAAKAILAEACKVSKKL